MSFNSQFAGSIAATVNNPKGGKLAFLEINFNACLRLQKVFGEAGLISSIFIKVFFPLNGSVKETCLDFFADIEKEIGYLVPVFLL
jgi:hypothetical protein